MEPLNCSVCTLAVLNMIYDLWDNPFLDREQVALLRDMLTRLIAAAESDESWKAERTLSRIHLSQSIVGLREQFRLAWATWLDTLDKDGECGKVASSVARVLDVETWRRQMVSDPALMGFDKSLSLMSTPASVAVRERHEQADESVNHIVQEYSLETARSMLKNLLFLQDASDEEIAAVDLITTESELRQALESTHHMQKMRGIFIDDNGDRVFQPQTHADFRGIEGWRDENDFTEEFFIVMPRHYRWDRRVSFSTLNMVKEMGLWINVTRLKRSVDAKMPAPLEKKSQFAVFAQSLAATSSHACFLGSPAQKDVLADRSMRYYAVSQVLPPWRKSLQRTQCGTRRFSRRPGWV